MGWTRHLAACCVGESPKSVGIRLGWQTFLPIKAAGRRFHSAEYLPMHCVLPWACDLSNFLFIMEPSGEPPDRSSSQGAARFSSYRFLNPYATIHIQQGNLPHWRQDGVTYFVTFRLADSVPQQKLRLWRAARDRWLSRHPAPRSAEENAEYFDRFSARMEAWLDRGYGECLLRRPACAVIVAKTLCFFDGERYALGPFTVAPNHVHVLVTPKTGHSLDRILHSWKSYSAKAINHQLRRAGTVWQKESYDHILRSPSAAWRIERYIERHER